MSACLNAFLAGIIVAGAGAAAAHGQPCVDHSGTEIGLAGLRVQNFEVVEAAPERRVERGNFPDGTVLTAIAGSCDGRTLIVEADVAPDAQTAMRLTQIMGQIDRLTQCAPFDYERADATRNAAAAAIDAGQLAEAGVLADHGACAMSLGVEPGEGGRMTAIFTIATRG